MGRRARSPGLDHGEIGSNDNERQRSREEMQRRCGRSREAHYGEARQREPHAGPPADAQEIARS